VDRFLDPPQRYPTMWSQLKQLPRVRETIEMHGEDAARVAERNRAVEVAMEKMASWIREGYTVHVCLTNNLLRAAGDVLSHSNTWEFVEVPQTWDTVKELCYNSLCDKTIQYYDHVDVDREIELCIAYLSEQQSSLSIADDPLAEALVLSSFDFMADFLQTEIVRKYLQTVLKVAKVDVSDSTRLRQALSQFVPVNIWIEPQDETLAGYHTKLFFVPKQLLLDWGNAHGAITQDADTTLYLNVSAKMRQSMATPQKEIIRRILACPQADEHYLRCSPYAMKTSETIVVEDDDVENMESTSTFNLTVPTSNTFSADFGQFYIMHGDISIGKAVVEARTYRDTGKCEATVTQWSENTYGFALGPSLFVVNFS